MLAAAMKRASSVDETVAFGATTHATNDYRGATWTDTRTGGADGVSRYALVVTGSGQQNGLYGGTITYYDGDNVLRFIFEKGYNVGGFTTSFTRDEAAILPIEWKILTGETYDRGIKFLTNIASFEAA